jgi:hypothetical protein
MDTDRIKQLEKLGMVWSHYDVAWEEGLTAARGWSKRSPGPRPVPDRLCLQSILYVPHNDMAWRPLPPEPGFGSGRTCQHRPGR